MFLTDRRAVKKKPSEILRLLRCQYVHVLYVFVRTVISRLIHLKHINKTVRLMLTTTQIHQQNNQWDICCFSPQQSSWSGTLAENTECN